MANKAGLKNSQTVYSATYSNVPVYEFNLPPNHVMRRRSDDWINATHILKVADYDKPARTRILEREVQKGVHEKVQGGYGKYQGTWIPLPDGRELAAKNGVLDKLRPIFDFVPGDRSPPPAPKHETAASSKPRVPRQAAAQARRAATAAAVQPPYQHAQDYEQLDVRTQEGAETPAEDAQTVASESQFDEYEHQAPPSRKRKRRPGNSPSSPPPPRTSQADREHYMWADEVLDYFMLQDPSLDSPPLAYPAPPSNASLNRPIDEKGHTALHWAAAMGDIEVVKDLIRRGASIDSQSATGETPLMRAVTFTNCFDKQNMERLAALLVRTINMQDWTTGSTAFHHVAGITQSKKKYECARYYLDCLLAKVVEMLSPNDVERVLNEQDRSGDTAITIAARHGARKCVRSLIGRNAAVGIVNHVGETADQLIVQLNFRRQERRRGVAGGSSSPFQGGQAGGGAVRAVPALRGVGFGSVNGGHAGGGGGGEGGFADLGLGGGEDGWKSEAALTLTSSIFPSMAAKSQLLARTFDAEVREKDAELAEAERVVSVRQAELESMRRQAEELRAREVEQMGELVGSEFGEEDEERVLSELVVECEGLVQEEAGEVLRELIAAEEAKLGLLPGSQLDSDGDPDLEGEDGLNEHFQLARSLLALHGQRQGLLSRIVANLAMAGYRSNDAEARERRGMYKKLIEGALMVRGEEVEGLLPEMLRDLEEGGVGGGAGGFS